MRHNQLLSSCKATTINCRTTFASCPRSAGARGPHRSSILQRSSGSPLLPVLATGRSSPLASSSPLAMPGTCQKGLKPGKSRHNSSLLSSSNNRSGVFLRAGQMGDFSLSTEQQEAVHSRHQHVMVKAGPGAGKTSVLVGRLAKLIAEGTPARDVLFITFTNKAAEEVKQRVEQLLGAEVAKELAPCTFHTLCYELLVKSRQELGDPLCLGAFSVADEADSLDVIRSLLLANMPGWPSPTDEDVKKFKDRISDLKNFMQGVYGLTGEHLVQEAVDKGVRGFKKMKPDDQRAMAAMYDAYTAALAARGQLDYDDLLHHCLALLRTQPELRDSLHGFWSHVLIDEAQDTNRCQFKIVDLITGPASSLFMVGDPYQALYCWRGAMPELMSEMLKKLPHGTTLTYTLSANYRSREAIVAAADQIRYQGKHGAPGVATRDNVAGATHVLLVEATSEEAEAARVVKQLREWREAGYDWDDMALLFRTNQQVRDMYKHLRKKARDIPCTMSANTDFWDSLGVRAALGLLRCVVHPAAAGEGLVRVLQKWQEAGFSTGGALNASAVLGNETLQHVLARLQHYLAHYTNGQGAKSGSSSGSNNGRANNGSRATFATSSSSSSSSSNAAANFSLQSLGSCLFGDCSPPEPLNPAEAAHVLQQWEAATKRAVHHLAPAAASWTASGAGRLPSPTANVLQQLSPSAWQPPQGFQLTSAEQAAVDGLRGLVRLGRAAADQGWQPDKVLQLLLELSGVQGQLAATEAAGGDKAREAKQQLLNLDKLLRLAANPQAYSIGPAANVLDGLVIDQPKQLALPLPAVAMLGNGTAGEGSLGSSSSSNDGVLPATVQLSPGMWRLLRFYNSCIIAGRQEPEGGGEPAVQLMTVHAAKGKEFACVWVMHVKAGGYTSGRDKENALYVACTRAKEHLGVSWSKGPSPLLKKLIQAVKDGKLHGGRFEWF